MTTKLTLFNDALLHCGERFLTSLTQEVESRRLLDQVWASGAIKKCLEMGQWNFAMCTIQIDYDPGIEPDFGYNRAFVKPDDWVLTSGLCSDEFFREPLLRYTDEAGYWYAELDTIYVRYVSMSDDYGNDMNKWPESFREYVAAYLATRIIKKITGSSDKEADMEKTAKKLLALAKSRAAMAMPTSFTAQGSWTRARTRRNNRNDGGNGNSGSLIG